MAAGTASEARALYESLASETLPALNPPGGPMRTGRWQAALSDAMDRLHRGDPEAIPYFPHASEEFVTIFDGFPKSRVHLLVMPKQRIARARVLRQEHLPLLRRMAAYTAWLVEQLQIQNPTLSWRQGIHVNPTLEPLHLHVLSEDFQGPNLKNKKHYNSFQPPFLQGLEEVIRNLVIRRPGGAVAISERDAEDSLKADMICSNCGRNFRNQFKELCRHLEVCPRPPEAIVDVPKLLLDAAEFTGDRRGAASLQGLGQASPSGRPETDEKRSAVDRGRWSAAPRIARAAGPAACAAGEAKIMSGTPPAAGAATGTTAAETAAAAAPALMPTTGYAAERPGPAGSAGSPLEQLSVPTVGHWQLSRARACPQTPLRLAAAGSSSRSRDGVEPIQSVSTKETRKYSLSRQPGPEPQDPKHGRTSVLDMLAKKPRKDIVDLLLDDDD
nr:aprataxin [Crypthecodinium cohnii]